MKYWNVGGEVENKEIHDKKKALTGYRKWVRNRKKVKKGLAR